MQAQAQIDRAYRLGTRDALAGRPALDVDDAESAVLMDELGETSAATEANCAARLAMCDAYMDGYRDALGALS